ncbi:hypothetical protein RYA05_05110 [Pseudomonas syringae pv. actinidiae]|nr:hypothetical protein [Pseudomonas syringae pv. actinidiae]
MIGLAYIDATFTDVAALPGAIEIRKYSAPFYVEHEGMNCILNGLVDGLSWSEGDHASAFLKGADSRRKTSQDVFLARFSPIHIMGRPVPGIHSLKQPSLLAIEMKHPFGVNVLVTNEEGDQIFEHRSGAGGDYLVQTASGSNDIVKRSDFERLYQTEAMGFAEMPKGTEVMLRQAMKKAQERSRAFSPDY